MMACSCNPTRVKMKTLARKRTVSQNPVACRRVAGVTTVGVKRFTYTPAATTARTPDNPSRCAGTYATNGVTTEITIASWGSSTRLHASTATNAFADDIGSSILVGVDIPSTGCWEITGQLKGKYLSFVVWVR